ncbi:MAG TPA: phosphoserine phosphatase SerB [Prolixibacteraceae bacterium]|nr:phosphoserine phosphatase SerB [Prolixibacteraceae bacterium]HPS12318.1 phosphoserine phosphatase SerB [Prolixibacteraceae bacterium]
MEKQHEIILLNIYGNDRPGLTSSLTQILASYDVTILDIGQAVIHNNLDLGILFEVPFESESSPILKDLLFKGYELGVRVKFTPISETEYNLWVNQQGKGRYIITLVGRVITAQNIAEVTKIVYTQQLNIDKISRISGRILLTERSEDTKACVELLVRGTPLNIAEMKSSFLALAHTLGVDIAFQEDNIYRRTRRLVCFDMDSTLIQTEVIDELAHRAGVGEEVSRITESAMRGEIDFAESFRQRIALLKGLDEKVMREIAENLPLTEGTERLFRTLKKYGFKTAILSGGFTYFGKQLQNKLGIDYVFANQLEVVDGKLTGNHVGDIIDGAKKAELLRNIAFKEDIHLEQTVAVGDGSNDLPMLNIAGLGIAFHAKPLVKKNAQHAISTTGLDAILFLMGFRERDIE